MAKVVTVKADSGVSFEFNKVWYKFNYSEEVKLEPEDDYDVVVSELWNRVNEEIDNQVQQVTEELK